MARTLRQPTEAELPSGPVRDFVDLLFHFYRSARRPTLRDISERIRKEDLPGTASTETIRRMLRGATVPAHWETVEALFEALTAIANSDPNGSMRWGNRQGASRWILEELWHRALDNPDLYYRQQDEPPF